ncbi:sulfatase-like hydrolase/transferase [Rhodopirellula sallentina]|uniref:Secreted protein containing Sulfatase domain protein n=1 Tax=Rhodopirellula sallentina SM41 TaxID=1263870 RepID=M5U9Z8_9BACT|nr:sulfatase-like hydrolase/transferase [Rhodopirellula sallentina]EMI58144.1 secreted protein containing Sulfatase domain protein [Rhodopirellula sallentina SM41]
MIRECNLLLLVPLLAFSSMNVTLTKVAAERPNIVFILTDDHRSDCLGVSSQQRVRTPNLDRIAASGTRFTDAFVTLAICSPSRAACLTGRYGSSNGVTAIGRSKLNPGEPTFAKALRKKGYRTGVTGKWHLGTTPAECGFDFASTCWSNGTWYDRQFTIDGKKQKMPGFVDDVTASESIRFMRQAQQDDEPFVLWMCTQVPHMDHKLSWPASKEYLDQYDQEIMPLPQSWDDDLDGKPEYLKTSRNRTRGLEYGYDKPQNIRRHTRDYYASVQQMDAAVGRVIDELDQAGLRENTWIIVMGDNGWMLGEHGMTSKVLPYEESMRVPMAIAGPNTPAQVRDDLVLNIDLTATVYELAGLPVPQKLHGRSLLPLVAGETTKDWRTSFLYEAPTPQLGSQPLWAIRNHRWKYIETEVEGSSTTFAELYDLQSDAVELKNLAADAKHQDLVNELREDLHSQRERIEPKHSAAKHPVSTKSQSAKANVQDSARNAKIPASPPQPSRTDIHISGVYPHLTTYGVYSQNGAHYKDGHNECGIGAVVPWAGKLWMVNYAPHQPRGSEHKLYSIDPDLSKPMTVHPESVGGTPAGRMIHKESNQLLIAHHLIDADGNVRTIQPADMPIRVTAIARHLEDPANMVYYVDMEGSIWEANVYTLAVKRLFKKPVPGWHGKGGYTSQGRLVISNNGELHVGNYNDVLVGGKAKTPEERGVLAEYDGKNWKIVERHQFTEVTGPKGITGGSDGDDPIWTMGWDRRSVRLKVLDDGQWHTYLLPKAAYCNDAKHGWYTEWPRIREITDGRWLMDMHGMFFDFPKTFTSKNSAGIVPVGSHLRYVPDFCDWNGQLVLATDETSIQGNPLAGQPQSNLWFGDYEDLKQWGPASGYGGPWMEDDVQANTPSDPFLVAGFDRRILHLVVGKKTAETKTQRTADDGEITELPSQLSALPTVTIPRGNWRKPTPGFEFQVDQPVTVNLAVDGRSDFQPSDEWKLTDLSLTWDNTKSDRIYTRDFPAGKVTIPGLPQEHHPGAYAMPGIAFVKSRTGDQVNVRGIGDAKVTTPPRPVSTQDSKPPVQFQLQVDRKGDGSWDVLDTIEVAADAAVAKILPADLDAIWLRIVADRDCVATAMLHQTTATYVDGTTDENRALFAGLADVADEDALESMVYPAKRNRNLRVITKDQEYFDFTKATFQFQRDTPDAKLRSRLHAEPEFTVDEASVILKVRGRTLRLPKGNDRYDKPFADGWPRASREVESERHLANIHGTFYEVPLVINGAPPAWTLMRPVSSHSKRISDYCTWNGLLVLCGVRSDATNDDHVFLHPDQRAGLWFGGIDDLWKLGKPVGKGGPWRNTRVKAGTPSDSYLIKGYDQKTARLSHDSSTPVAFTLQIDLDGTGLWVDYKTISVAPSQVTTFEFPEAFSASWIRGVVDQDATATLQFEYR